MSARCPHGMPTPAACWPCMEDGNLEPPPPLASLTVERYLDARFDGQCRGCNTGIHVGQPIARLSDGTYQHQVCAGGGP